MIKSISLERRNKIIGMVAAGTKLKRVSTYFKVHMTSVSRIVSLHRRTGGVVPGQSSGRPRITTPAQDWFIVNAHLR